MIDEKASLTDRVFYALCWVTAADMEASLELDMSQEEIADFLMQEICEGRLVTEYREGKGWALKPASPSLAEH